VDSSRDFACYSPQISAMRTYFWLLLVCLWFGLQLPVTACIWDSDTLADERKKSPNMAEVILGKSPDLGDPAKLRKRITELEANRREDEPAWWNDLAGAHIRLGENQKAATLLESVLARFPDDYGVHANLGTAYHLLGRYADAEKEIARDLEINPAAHFGLEKYHLALLQYLIRDAKYQSRHVYVDEFTAGFLITTHGEFYPKLESAEEQFKSETKHYTNGLAEAEEHYDSLLKANADQFQLMLASGTTAALDSPPAYRSKGNLAQDPKLQDGVIYMASLNPKEPACFTMLGVVCWSQGDLNLAATAFDKAIQLGSPQAPLLKSKLKTIQNYIQKSQNLDHGHKSRLIISQRIAPFTFPVVFIAMLIFLLVKGFFRGKA
jgi:tetratricopeptide (TPR) repeat protein